MKKEQTKESNIHAGHRERLRNVVFTTKLNGCSEVQVLEYLLSFVIARKDTNPIAHELLNKFGNMKNICLSPNAELTQVKNVGNHTANFLRSLPIVFNYFNERYVEEDSIPLNTALKVSNYASRFFRNADCEQMMIIITDDKVKTIAHKIITLGVKENVSVKLSNVLTMLEAHNSKNFIIVHNHIDTTCKPSIEDNTATRKLLIACELNGIKLLDHLIVGKDGYYSYRKNGALDVFEREVKLMVAGGINGV